MKKLLVTLLVGSMFLLTSCVAEYNLSDPAYHGYYDFRSNVQAPYVIIIKQSIVKIHMNQRIKKKTKVVKKR